MSNIGPRLWAQEQHERNQLEHGAFPTPMDLLGLSLVGFPLVEYPLMHGGPERNASIAVQARYALHSFRFCRLCSILAFKYLV